MDDTTTYELRVLDLDGLWFYVVLRNGREPVEVSKPYGPVFPHFAQRDATEDGEQRLAVWLKIHETLAREYAKERWDAMQAVVKGGET
jgi:hypothetical protein